ncbi:hypothetical protein JCM5353_008880 [Sporobolomyces roseus]
MPFSSLPQELVDHLAVFVGYVDGRFLDFASVRSLCLVSRKTLPSARRVLYHSPFHLPKAGPYTWNRAQTLLATLESDNASFGQLVRDTFGITNWARDLQATSHVWSNTSRALEWYCAILRACSNVEHVYFCYSTQNELDTLFGTLTNSRSTFGPSHRAPPSLLPLNGLRSISFAQHLIGFRPSIDFSDIFATLRQSPLLSLDEVKFSQIECALPLGNNPATPSFPLQVKSLYLHNETTSFPALVPFFPEDPSTLEKFRFEGYANEDGSDLLSLQKLVGSNLKTLSLLFFVHDEQDPEIPQIPGAKVGRPRIFPEALGSYPQLTSLTLCGIREPSLSLLETLLVSSPLLSTVRFIHSQWVYPANNESTSPDEVFPEVRILAVLLKFPRLKFIDLGILPTFDKNRYRSFVLELSKGCIDASFEVMKSEGE